MRKAIIGLLMLSGVHDAMAYEEPEYKLLAKTPEYEIREYAEYIVAEVDVAGSMGDTGNTAFRILAGYIFGDNSGAEEMNMTAPVEARRADDNTYTYAFMMERRYALDALPEPADERIRLTKRPARVMAARRYSGSWREANYRNNAAKLIEALDVAGLAHSGNPILARYNSPFTPWFLRRNEVLVELKRNLVD